MKNKTNKRKKNLWAGRFNDTPSDIMSNLNASISFDKKLYDADIRASISHAEMLANQNIISPKEAKLIIEGLLKIKDEIKNNKMKFKNELEDIHTHIEARLIDLIGLAGKKLHTARSRNDQVATTTKIWAREECFFIDILLKNLQEALLNKATKHIYDIMPGFTHLQPAQPILLSHHLLAYVNMFGRDRENYKSLIERHNFSPLGSAALAGTTFNINREETSSKLGFKGIMRNSLDAVSDRDFVLDILNLCSHIFIHLSRLSEEIVIWSSAGFNFTVLSDKFSTGSSIMPQKKNPDAAELIRGKSGRIIGNYVALYNVMKALPLAYSKDMQEDKEPVFDAEKSLCISLMAMTGMIEDMTAHPEAMRQALRKGHPAATDLADYLVAELNIPFRNAHHITGALVALADEKGCGLDDLSLEELQSVEPQLTGAVQAILSIDHAVAARTSYGGTAPDQERARIAEARAQFLLLKDAT